MSQCAEASSNCDLAAAEDSCAGDLGSEDRTDPGPCQGEAPPRVATPASVNVRASNEGPRRFNNHGGGPYKGILLV